VAKITHIFKTYFPETSGGVEEAIRQYSTIARQNGFDVDIISVAPITYTLSSADGSVVKFFKKNLDLVSNPFSFSLALSFNRIIKNTDILHFHFPWPTAELLVLSHYIRKPCLVTFHCDIHKIKSLKKMYLPFIRQYLRKMDKICISSRRLLLSTPYLEQFSEKIEEIPYFLNENRFSNLPGPDSEIIDFVQKKKRFVLFVGVLRWYKGLDILLDASGQIDAEIVIVGKGDMYDKLASRIHEEKLRNVHLIGFQSDNNLKYLIESSKMIVLPSTNPAEAFGQILLEGLYFSKPLISTEIGTATSVVNKHNHTGFVVQPGCSVSLARAANTIIKNDALYEQLSKNALHHYLTNFKTSVQGEKYIRIYNALLQY
jgi:rhamnosyl/mannosyltransferase